MDRTNNPSDSPGLELAVPSAEQVLDDPSASHWLKVVLQSALTRDSVDAANDAEVLAEILRLRVKSQFESHLQNIVQPGRVRADCVEGTRAE